MKNKVNIVGILNLSPESFGSEAYTDMPAILARAGEMLHDGADYIDVGAQSTRPGSVQLSLEEELGRLRGVVAGIKAQYPNAKVSVDTTRVECIELALSEGADMVNDISGGRFDPSMAKMVAESGVQYVLMHSQGSFDELHAGYEYTDIMADIRTYFEEKVEQLLDAGVSREQIILDPGIGFSKKGAQNIEILNRLNELHSFALPLYVGVSRKKFIGEMIGEPDPTKRDVATTVVHALCIQKGVAYIRTHNVAYAKECVQVMNAL